MANKENIANETSLDSNVLTIVEDSAERGGDEGDYELEYTLSNGDRYSIGVYSAHDVGWDNWYKLSNEKYPNGSEKWDEIKDEELLPEVLQDLGYSEFEETIIKYVE